AVSPPPPTSLKAMPPHYEGKPTEGPLPGNRPTCSYGNNPAAPENPAPYTSTGSPAPVWNDVAGRPHQFSSTGAAIKIAKKIHLCSLLLPAGTGRPFPG